MMYKHFFKRFFDIFSSSIAIILLSPVFLILGIIVKCTSKGPVFYSHKRVGKNGKEIGVLKFRSMVKNADKLIENFSDEQKAEFQKYYKLETAKKIMLHPENEKYEDIVIRDCDIMGVAVKIIKDLW